VAIALVGYPCDGWPGQTLAGAHRWVGLHEKQCWPIPCFTQCNVAAWCGLRYVMDISVGRDIKGQVCLLAGN
jgi:hypothetical protein